MIIGICGGGRGAGKSTISRLLEEYIPNSILISCDKYMHEYSEKLENQIFKKLKIEKNPNIFRYNYFFQSYNNVTKWIKTIENPVIEEITEEIRQNEDKIIIIEWCFLPLCDFFNKCNIKICVNADYSIREQRLKNRLLNKDKSIYDKNDIAINKYTPKMLEKSLELTDFTDKGFEFDYYINNNSSFEILKENVKDIAHKIIAYI